MATREIEEVLESIWTCSEQNEHRMSVIREKSHVDITADMIEHMEKEGLIAYGGDNVLLTYSGKLNARKIIRRHRLAERLLVDVLNLPMSKIEEAACEFEHMVAEEVVDSICTLLGHPAECPHGSPIPESKCCLETRSRVESIITPLDKLEVGTNAKVAYFRTKEHSRLNKLISYGITPGMPVKIRQKKPVFVLQCDQTEVALEEDVVGCVQVWKKPVEETTAAGKGLRKTKGG